MTTAHPHGLGQGDGLVRVVALIGQQGLGVQAFDQAGQLADVGKVPRRQLESKRMAQGVAYRMNFCV